MATNLGRTNARNSPCRESSPKKNKKGQRRYKYLGLDLDNTLHDFRSASKAAMEAVYAYISEETGVGSFELSKRYKKIFEKAESEGFTERISRTEYRKRRFLELLKEFKISPEYIIDDLLRIYEKTFIKNLHVYEEMKDFVREAHNKLGLEVIIISEGPEDAQNITLKELGIKDSIDKLFTTSAKGTSKTEKLFFAVLEDLNCQPEEIFYIGDSKERDIEPAEKAGIRAALFDPQKQFAPQIEKFSQAINQTIG